MRVPRDIGRYRPVEEVALALESCAARLRSNSEVSPLAKYEVNLWHWNPDWADKPKATKRKDKV